MFKAASRILPALVTFMFLVSISTSTFAGVPQDDDKKNAASKDNKDNKKDQIKDKDK